MNSKKGIMKKIVLFSSILLVAIVIGTVIGNSFITHINNTAFLKYNNEDYKDLPGDFTTLTTTAPESLLALEAYRIATAKLNNLEFYNILGSGVVKVENGFLGELKLWGSAKKSNGVIDTSIVSYNQILTQYRVGLSYKYYIAEQAIDFCFGKSYFDGAVDWDKPNRITPEEYIKEWGLEPTEFFTYTISSKTVMQNSEATTFVDENGKTLLKFSMKLDPLTSTINYKTQLKKMSKLNNAPIFKYVYFNFIIDDNFNLRNVEIEEAWSVYFHGPILNCKSKIAYDFSYSE